MFVFHFSVQFFFLARTRYSFLTVEIRILRFYVVSVKKSLKYRTNLFWRNSSIYFVVFLTAMSVVSFSDTFSWAGIQWNSISLPQLIIFWTKSLKMYMSRLILWRPDDLNDSLIVSENGHTESKWEDKKFQCEKNLVHARRKRHGELSCNSFSSAADQIFWSTNIIILEICSISSEVSTWYLFESWQCQYEIFKIATEIQKGKKKNSSCKCWSHEFSFFWSYWSNAEKIWIIFTQSPLISFRQCQY